MGFFDVKKDTEVKGSFLKKPRETIKGFFAARKERKDKEYQEFLQKPNVKLIKETIVDPIQRFSDKQTEKTNRFLTLSKEEKKAERKETLGKIKGFFTPGPEVTLDKPSPIFGTTKRETSPFGKVAGEIGKEFIRGAGRVALGLSEVGEKQIVNRFTGETGTKRTEDLKKMIVNPVFGMGEELRSPQAFAREVTGQAAEKGATKGFQKALLPLTAVGGFILESPVNPFGKGKGAVKALSKADDVETAIKVLTKEGIESKVAKELAPELVKMTDEVKISRFLTEKVNIKPELSEAKAVIPEKQIAKQADDIVVESTESFNKENLTNLAKRQDTFDDFETAIKRGPSDELPFYKAEERTQILNPNYQKTLQAVKDAGYKDLKEFYTSVKGAKKQFFGEKPTVPVAKKVSSIPAKKVKIPDDIAKLEDDVAKIDLEIEQTQSIIDNHPGKKLKALESRKEGEFIETKSPDLAKTPAERRKLEAREKKVQSLAKSAFEDNPRLADLYDDPDVIKEQIEEYRSLVAKVDDLKKRKGSLAKEYRGARDNYIAQERDKVALGKIAAQDEGEFRDFYNKNFKKPKGKQKAKTQPEKQPLLKTTGSLLGEKSQTSAKPAKRDPLAKKKKVGSSYEDIVLDADGNVKVSSPIKVDADGNVVPKAGRGGIAPPQLDIQSWKDKGIFWLNRETLERNIDDIMPKGDAEKVHKFIIDPIRKNETLRTEFVNKYRTKIKDKYKELGIKVGSKADRFVQLLGEGAATLDQVAKEIPEQKEAVQKAITFFRNEYDGFLTDVNKVRSVFGYNPIPKRKDYFRHFREINDVIGQFGLIFRKQDLPTEIAGMTDIFKPGKPFSTAELKRMGTATDISAAKGMDNYIESIGNQIFHTDSVQRARSLERYIRDSAKYAAEKATDSSEFIELPNFVANLSDYGNRLAGKKSRADRALESLVGRRIFAISDFFRKATGANMVGGNISSALTNYIPLTQSIAATEKKYVLRGLFDGLASPILKDPAVIGDQVSPFLRRRFPEDPIISDLFIPKSKKEIRPFFGSLVSKGGKKAGALFEFVDQFTSRSIVSGKYYENLAKGMDPKEAMRLADEFAGKVIADRSFGQTPNLFANKSVSAFTQFQLEVNNVPSFLIKDIPKIAKGDRKKIASMLAQFAILSYAFGTVYEKVTGRRPALDPLYAALTIAGLQSDSKDIEFKKRLIMGGENILENLPYSGLLLQGGRIPLSAGLPNLPKVITGDAKLKDELKKPLYTVLPPFGGAQAKKTIEGIKAYKEGEVESKSGNRLFHIEKGPLKALKMAIFGKWSTKEARETFNKNDLLYSLIDNQENNRTKLSTDAEKVWLEIKNLKTPEERKDLFKQLAETDEELAKKVKEVALDEKKGLDSTDRLIKQLGVSNGARAQYIYTQLQKMESEEKKAYIKDLREKDIVSDTVLSQIKKMFADGKPTFEQGEATDERVLDTVLLYAKAIGTDPVTAFDRIFKGDKIRRIDNRTIIVERMSLDDSQAEKRKRGADMQEMKLDHTVPLQLGGSNGRKNLKLVSNEEWESYTPVENYLGKLLRDGKIKKKEAQDLIKRFKEGEITFEEIKNQVTK